MIPHRTPFLLPWLYPSLQWRIPTDDNTIFITFDDGPIPGVTEEVLAILNQYNAKASFFCIGDNVKKHPEVFNKVAAGGHAIGNHTFHHVSGWKTSTERYKEEVDQADEIIRHHLRNETQLFRPPYGRITNKQIKSIRHKIVMWDVLSFDYDSSYPKEKCLRGTMKATRSGSIVVFHDSLKASRNMLYTLPRFLDVFAGKGYTFKALGQ